MIGVIFTFCTLDGELVEHSESYKLVKWLLGEDTANLFLEEREVLITKPPPESDADGRYIGTGDKAS